MKRKAYAVSLGLANEGRGRMSREALAAVEKARSEGMVFDDDVETRIEVKRQKAEKRAQNPKPSGVVADPVFYYSMDAQFQGKDSAGKVHTISGRGVCRTTGVSMVGCGCGPVHQTLAPNLEVISVTHKE